MSDEDEPALGDWMDRADEEDVRRVVWQVGVLDDDLDLGVVSGFVRGLRDSHPRLLLSASERAHLGPISSDSGSLGL
eukprot:COSAG06_NODE_13374_length_1263_cov_89.564433_2_plen_77_part_00